MKALTVCQPYASMIGPEKPIENRVWPTSYRGVLAIHAGKSRDWLIESGRTSMTFGAVVSVGVLTDCVKLADLPAHLRGHEHANGPWCWLVGDVYRLRVPVPCRGAQGLWNLPADVERAVVAQIAGWSHFEPMACRVQG